MTITDTALSQLLEWSTRLRDYLTDNVAGSGIDVPDEVWLPFTAALSFADRVANSPTTAPMPGQEPSNAGAMTSEELSKSLDVAHETAKHSKLRFGPGASA